MSGCRSRLRKRVVALVRGRGVAGACAHVLEVIKNDLGRVAGGAQVPGGRGKVRSPAGCTDLRPDRPEDPERDRCPPGFRRPLPAHFRRLFPNPACETHRSGWRCSPPLQVHRYGLRDGESAPPGGGVSFSARSSEWNLRPSSLPSAKRISEKTGRPFSAVVMP